MGSQLESLFAEPGKDQDSFEGKRVTKPLSWKNVTLSENKLIYMHCTSCLLHSINLPCLASLRSIAALEAAVELLEKEFEKCESVRVEVTGLDTKGSMPPDESTFLEFQLWLHSRCLCYAGNDFVFTYFAAICNYLLRGKCFLDSRLRRKIESQMKTTTTTSLVQSLSHSILFGHFSRPIPVCPWGVARSPPQKLLPGC